ncbi:OmpW/AlkL family protein [Psychrobacter sp. Sarcosine-3u-12]|uniref:OmpW/AlkL family protein n=1 Tax=Psychrobacter sp. Sarcosine-3u-12 TaxID=2058325 RepID=UPI001D0D4A94|nr:OmpW family outer membrane protein [Psychrobacter sp. Sarcosine-3u-12]
MIASNRTLENGSVRISTVREVIDPDQDSGTLRAVNGLLGILPADTDLGELGASASGTVNVNGLESWTSAGTGLESDDVDTAGLLFNYYFDDNWSVEFKAGIPPKVDIMGKGQVFAPFTGEVNASGIGSVLPEFAIKKDIPITDLEQGNGVASTARAWLPAAGIQYQFGQSGVNKFRPYVVAGVMYAYFNDIDLNDGIRQDLERAGDQIQNIKDGKAGAALENVKSSSAMKVDVEADSAFAPILTLGATYDFNDRWFGVGSLSYAKLDSDTTITVKNEAGEKLIRAKSNLDIDPYITYLGVGYRF